MATAEPSAARCVVAKPATLAPQPDRLKRWHGGAHHPERSEPRTPVHPRRALHRHRPAAGRRHLPRIAGRQPPPRPHRLRPGRRTSSRTPARSNGTFVNGHRIAGPGAAHRGRHPADRPLRAGPARREAADARTSRPRSSAPASTPSRRTTRCSPRTRRTSSSSMLADRPRPRPHARHRPAARPSCSNTCSACSPRPTAAWCCSARATASSSARQRTRQHGEAGDYPYSRTIVRRALDEGVGLLSEDVRGDRNLVLSATLVSLNLRSFLCVPLIGWEGRRLGVIQLDCLRQGQQFRADDLEMLTAVALQAGGRAAERRLPRRTPPRGAAAAGDPHGPRHPAAVLADATSTLPGPTAELFAQCLPAREVSGDLYDFFRLGDGRLAFFVGDVSGKGMPAALFMIAVRTLARHLAPSATGPADFLQRLNVALTADNPTHLYVTMIFAHLRQRATARSCSPAAATRRRCSAAPTARSTSSASSRACCIGSAPVPLRLTDTRIELAPGETLILYTDGYVEATAPDGTTEFGLDRLRDSLGRPRGGAAARRLRRRGGGRHPALHRPGRATGRPDAAHAPPAGLRGRSICGSTGWVVWGT